MIAGYLGGGIFQFPRELVDFAGPDAGWAYLALAAYFLGLVWIYIQIAEIAPDRAFSSVINTVLTPVVGWPVQTVRLGLHLVLGIIVTANFGQVMHTFFLTSTPTWAIEASLVATGLYMAWYGTAAFARTLETILLPTLLGSVTIGILVISRMQESWAILPVGHLAIGPTLAGAYHSAYIFVGFETLAQAYGHVRVDRRKAARRNAYLVYGATVMLFAYGYAVTIGTEGPAALATLQWPPVSALRLANLHGFFISKLGLLVVVLWGLLALSFIGARLWCIGQNLAERPDRHIETTRYHVVLVLTAIATWSGAQALNNVVMLVHDFQVWGLPFVMIYLTSAPILLLSVARLTRGRRTAKAQSST